MYLCSTKMNVETIVLKDLGIGYPSKHGVRVVAEHINGAVRSGELTCLLGANGVGKSTLLRTLSAFQPKVSGEILFAEEDVQSREISEMSDKELSRKIGVVLTEKPDVRNMTVHELVSLGRSPYTGFWGTYSKEDIQIVDESIALVGIESLSKRMVHTLSDGEMSRQLFWIIPVRWKCCSCSVLSVVRQERLSSFPHMMWNWLCNWLIPFG